MSKGSSSSFHPSLVQELILFLKRLPGIGHKTAERLAYELIAWESDRLHALAQILIQASSQLKTCKLCGAYSDQEYCTICTDPQRTSEILCVVETFRQIIPIESARFFSGRYHILGGKLSPLDGIGPEKLNLANLPSRIENEKVSEVIIAISPDVEGEATASYLATFLQERFPSLTVTRIGRGLPIGGDLAYADPATLSAALQLRQPIPMHWSGKFHEVQKMEKK